MALRKYTRVAALAGTALFGATLIYAIKSEIDDLYKVIRFMRNPEPRLREVIDAYQMTYGRKSEF